MRYEGKFLSFGSLEFDDFGCVIFRLAVKGYGVLVSWWGRGCNYFVLAMGKL